MQKENTVEQMVQIIMQKLILSIFMVILSLIPRSVFGAEIAEMGDAPDFAAQLQDGSQFELASRLGKWTILYFYPKAGTPGCTKQAQGFRDSIEKIRGLGAEVYGISGDSVAELADFHKKEQLNFSLIADPQAKIIDAYGAKMPLLKISKRWTFILDPKLKVKKIERDVEPGEDAQRIIGWLKDLQSTK